MDQVLGNPRKGKKVLKWSVGITTAPRTIETLTECLASVIESGWTPRIFAEPESPIPDIADSCPITWRSDQAGPWVNTYLGLQEMLARDPDADAYVLIQDDVVLATNENKTIREYLESALWPEEKCGFVSLYTNRKYSLKNPTYGWNKLDGKWVWGACAIVWPKESLIQFLSTIGIKWRMPGFARNNGWRNIDTAIGVWQKRYKRSAYFCVPSLAQHIGGTSTIWSKKAKASGDRRARYFYGDL